MACPGCFAIARADDAVQWSLQFSNGIRGTRWILAVHGSSAWHEADLFFQVAGWRWWLIITGWRFGRWILWLSIQLGNSNPNWRIPSFFRGVETTNQTYDREKGEKMIEHEDHGQVGIHQLPVAVPREKLLLRVPLNNRPPKLKS